MAGNLTTLGRLTEARKAALKVKELGDAKGAADKLNQIETAERLKAQYDSDAQLGSWESAVNRARDLMRVCPAWIEARVGLGRALIGIKQYQDAATIALAVLNENGQHLGGLLLRGEALWGLGNLTQVQPVLANLLRLDTDNSAALRLFKRAKKVEALKEKGNEAFRSGDNAKAAEHYKEALQEDLPPSYAATLYANRGAALMKLQQNEEAEQDLTKAIDLDPEYVKAYARRAQVLEFLGKWVESEADWNQACLKESENREYKQKLQEVKKKAKQAAKKDYYKILGVPRNANEAQIKKVLPELRLTLPQAYKKLALEYHPDKNTESEEARKTAEAKFKDISAAYACLTDPQKRAHFDAGGDDEMGDGGMGGHDMNDIFAQMFARRGGFPGGGGGFGGFGGGGFGGGFARGGSAHGHYGGYHDDEEDDYY